MQGAFGDAATMARAGRSPRAELASDQRPELEIAAHTMIGSVLMQLEGFTADPVRQKFNTVLHISSARQALGPNTAPALLGAHTHAIIEAQETPANRLGDLMDRMADSLLEAPKGSRSASSRWPQAMAPASTRAACRTAGLHRTDPSALPA